jgi:hypothetical protein
MSMDTKSALVLCVGPSTSYRVWSHFAGSCLNRLGVVRCHKQVVAAVAEARALAARHGVAFFGLSHLCAGLLLATPRCAAADAISQHLGLDPTDLAEQVTKSECVELGGSCPG